LSFNELKISAQFLINLFREIDFMSAKGKLLCDEYVEKLVCPWGRSHLEVFDGCLKGFYLDVLASGRKSFRLRYRFKNKLRITTLGCSSYLSAAEARKLAIQIIQNARAGVDPFIETHHFLGPTVQEFFVEKYLPYVKSYKRSWDTDESMIRNHLVTKLGGKRMSAISPPDVAVFVEAMKSANYAPGTCNRALVCLRYGFELAVRWKVPGIESNPVKEIKNLKDDNKIERFLTQDQTVRLLAAVRQSESEMLQHIVLFLIYTGARKREVLDAKWQDIDWTQKSWRIPKTKSGKIRHVPLSSGALELLESLKGRVLAESQEAKAYVDASKPIFANPKTGEPYVSFFYSWNSARIRAGLPDLRVHDLRHSFASFLVNAGRSLYEVQELLGHAAIRTTSRYAHLSRERLFAAVESVPRAGWESQA
jgi:site-specific recombinase XerD